MQGRMIFESPSKVKMREVRPNTQRPMQKELYNQILNNSYASLCSGRVLGTKRIRAYL